MSEHTKPQCGALRSSLHTSTLLVSSAGALQVRILLAAGALTPGALVVHFWFSPSALLVHSWCIRSSVCSVRLIFSGWYCTRFGSSV